MLTSTSLGSAAIGLHRRHNAKAKAMKAKEPTVKGPKVALGDRDEDTSPTRCLFCGHPSEDVDANVAHMEATHHFFVPMKARCSNVEGLLLYLSRKVNGLVCLVCNEKTRAFHTLDALRDHMRESNHERIVLSVEYNDFYDCTLEDPDNMQKVEIDGDQLVVAAGGDKGGRVVLRKEADVPRARPRESEQHAQQRKAILASENAALVAARKEQRELTTVERRQQGELTRRSDAEYQALQLKVSMRANKLHPKGYDGEGTLY
ncbi:pre-60S factor REI1 [Strigomonas culicis]|nr:pre-60S factor REI1 [Strigomonas culicis]|eukprot:EPY37137.1 pre-60S factor REI1 [Strigomonas culicis]